MEVLSCFASISNTNDDVFIQGFKISFWKISAENNFGFSAIEDISHNDIIINNIKQKTKPIIVSPTAYFFYNYCITMVSKSLCKGKRIATPNKCTFLKMMDAKQRIKPNAKIEK